MTHRTFRNGSSYHLALFSLLSSASLSLRWLLSCNMSLQDKDLILVPDTEQHFYLSLREIIKIQHQALLQHSMLLTPIIIKFLIFLTSYYESFLLCNPLLTVSSLKQNCTDKTANVSPCLLFQHLLKTHC